MKRMRRLFWGIGFFCFLLAGCTGGPSEHLSAANLGVAQDFTLKNLAGEDVNLKSLLGTHRAVLLNFWASWCPPCREEIPDLIKLQAQQQGRGFTLLGVDVGESHEKVSRFVEKVGINYPVVLDSDQSVSEMYRVVGIPTTLLVNSEGKILGEYHAYTRQLVADVEQALQ